MTDESMTRTTISQDYKLNIFFLAKDY